jgi:NAD(P)H-dependent flavin oxidoreductase YrpB (nitropropane dioxygenase family)
MMFSGREVLPLFEGGKGISVSNGLSAGAWAKAGGVGTFSAVNADSYDEQGRPIPIIYHGKTRRERHHELIAYAIRGGVNQAKIAYETACHKGTIHMNVLWEMAGVEEILRGILERVKGLVGGITCGAGMPYRVAQIAAQFKVYYYPIVSSARAFRALWKRSYCRMSEWLGGVVYEDPWLAGGHNGLSNSENPQEPQPPYERVIALREMMREMGAGEIPIIMAGGVWFLREWKDWINNPKLGPIAFQFGTRPLLTQESPISDAWKQKLLTLKPGDVFLNRFSPTGFYSSAVKNDFLAELQERSQRQIACTAEPVGDHDTPLAIGRQGRVVYVTHHDHKSAINWIEQGYTEALKTPDSTLIFLTPEKSQEIRVDQINCMGCLSACLFSNWSQGPTGNTGRKADPRSYCIQKTLQDISHSGDINHNLMFAGHNAYRFADDPFYKGGFIPTVEQLIERILMGD